jgi:hypothetical protein
MQAAIYESDNSSEVMIQIRRANNLLSTKTSLLPNKRLSHLNSKSLHWLHDLFTNQHSSQAGGLHLAQRGKPGLLG